MDGIRQINEGNGNGATLLLTLKAIDISQYKGIVTGRGRGSLKSPKQGVPHRLFL